MRVVITDTDLGSTDIERDVLLRAFSPGLEVEVAACRSEDDVIAAGRGADALIVQWAPVTARVIEQLDRCSVISRYGIGLDMIDVAAARAKGIAVVNVPHYCTEEVATHAVASLLALWRRLPQLDASVRAGTWNAGAVMQGVTRLSRATLGLVGIGRIGGEVARVLGALGVRTIAYDPYADGTGGIDLVGLDELAAHADLLSLHCPLTEETRHIVDARLLRTVKPNAVLVNTARGDLVDSSALVEALAAGRLAAAALDVFGEEPLAPDDPLRRAPNLVLSPHAAWCSQQALPTLQACAAQNVVDHFATRRA